MPTLEIVAPRSPLDVQCGLQAARALRAQIRVTGAHVIVSYAWEGKLALDRALAEVVRWDVAQRSAEMVPALYESGVRYRAEPRCLSERGVETCEEFVTATECARRGYGDCDDLAPWRAADLIVAGVPARAEAIRSPGVGWHVIVEHARGREDPSAQLGMGA